MKDSKLIRILASIATIAALSSPVKAEADDNGYLYLDMISNFGMLGVAKIETLPEEVRTIKGPHRSMIAPDSKLTSYVTNGEMGLGVGIGLKGKRVDFRIGPEVVILRTDSLSKGVEDESTSASYGLASRMNRDRYFSFGGSLKIEYIFPPGGRVASAGRRNIERASMSRLDSGIMDTLPPGYPGKGRPIRISDLVPTSIFLGTGLFLGYSAAFEDLSFYLETGGKHPEYYDAEYEMRVGVLSHRVSIGLESVHTNHRWGFYAGVSLPQIVGMNPLAEATGIKFSPGFFVGGSIGIRSGQESQ